MAKASRTQIKILKALEGLIEAVNELTVKVDNLTGNNKPSSEEAKPKTQRKPKSQVQPRSKG